MHFGKRVGGEGSWAPGGDMEGGSDAAAERAVDAATVALSRYEFFRVHEEPLGERPTFGSGPTAAAARLHESDRPKVLVCRSTKAYRRLALCVPRPGERTVDIGSAYGDATALMAEAAGEDAVLGIDVSKHFVDQSSAARPGLRFERLDALEDPALLAREIEGSVNVFVDIGGVRAAEALVRLLPAVAKSAAPSFIVVKCEALHDAMADAEVPFEGLRGATTITRFTVPERERSNGGANGVDDCDTDCGSSDSRWRDAVAVTASSASPVFWRKTCEREVGNVRARSAFKRAHVARSARPASDLFARYPLKYPPRFVRGDVEICRFHNYSADGCIRREKFGMCMFDHEHCHWCGEHGHRAWECEHAVKAHQSAVVDDGLAPAAAPVRDPNDGTANGVANGTANGVVDGLANGVVDRLANGIDEGLAKVSLAQPEDVYVYVAGGRNRGQTVGVTERYSLRRKQWERGPHIADPRGSHGLAAANGVVYAVAGGGIKSNLATAEALHAVADHASTAWVPAGVVAEARHALSACNTGDWGVCAIGGWADGNSCTGAVDFLDLRTDPTSTTWRSLAPLITPRKLHGAAGLPDGRLFVFGGRIGDHGGPIAGAEAYDPTSNEWRAIRPLPIGACACACVDGSDEGKGTQYVYVATWGADNPEGNKSTKRGGKDPRVGEAGALWRYDPDADTYERVCGLPLPEWYGFAMCAFDGWVYLIGGSTAGRWTGAAFRRRVDQGGESEWEELPPMKVVRRRTAAAVARAGLMRK